MARRSFEPNQNGGHIIAPKTSHSILGNQLIQQLLDGLFVI